MPALGGRKRLVRQLERLAHPIERDERLGGPFLGKEPTGHLVRRLADPARGLNLAKRGLELTRVVGQRTFRQVEREGGVWVTGTLDNRGRLGQQAAGLAVATRRQQVV